MTTRKAHLDSRAISLLLACCLFWGMQQILIKTTVGEVPPLWQAALRFAGATFLLWMWCLARKVDLFARDGTLGAGLLAGLLFAGEFSCIYLGLRDTTASRLTVFLYTSPFVVAALLPRLVPSEKLRTVQWIGLVVAFAAVAIDEAHPVPAVVAPLREPFGKCLLVLGQHVDRVVRSGAKHGQGSGRLRQAPEHQRRLQRHRVEGVGRQANDLALRGARSDDGHPGGEHAKGRTELLRRKARRLGLAWWVHGRNPGTGRVLGRRQALRMPMVPASKTRKLMQYGRSLPQGNGHPTLSQNAGAGRCPARR